MISTRSFQFAWVIVALASSLTACAVEAPRHSATNALASEDQTSPAGHSHDSAASATGGSSTIELGDGTAALETIAVWRGDIALEVAVLDSARTGATLATERTDFVETAQTNASGIEQSWQFEQAPGKAGDLIIAIGTTGLDYVGATATGLQLRRAAAFDVSYSHGTWIDASNHQWAIPAVHDHDRILLTVPASVLASSTFPAVLDPQIVVTPITGSP